MSSASNIERSSTPPPPIAVQPYIGLRPYEEADKAFFFGRNRDASLLVNKILAFPLTVLIAPSGVGKTSLLKVLVIPELRDPETLVVYVDKWLASPIQGIRRKVSRSLGKEAEGDEDRSLRELVGEANRDEKTVILILDQAEQLFIRHGGQIDAFGKEIGALLRSGADIHLVISLREEYLAGLDALRSHLLTIRQSTYRLVRLDGEDARNAIEKPVKEPPFEGEVESGLADELLKDLRASEGSVGVSEINAGSPGIDLPFLQIVCTTLWKAAGSGVNRRLSLSLYKKLGERGGIVQAFVEEIIQKLGSGQHAGAAKILDLLAPSIGVKMSYPVEVLEKQAWENWNIPSAQVQGILQALEDGKLIRRRESGKVVELWHDAFSQVLRPWIDQALLKDKVSKELVKRKKERGIKRNRILVILAAIAASGAALGWFVYNMFYVWEHAFYYREFVSVYGAPEGIGRELSLEQVRHRPLSFRIVKAGRFGRSLRMYAVNSLDDGQGDPEAREMTATNKLYLEADRAYLNPSFWTYDYNRDGKITSEYAYTKYKELVQAIVYTADTRPGSQAVLAYFMNSRGTPGPVKTDPNDSAFFWAKRIHYSARGHEELIEYLGASGEAVPGADQAFASKREYNEQGLVLSQISLDAKGQPMNDAFGNAQMKVIYDSMGDERETRAFDAEGKPTKVKHGWSIRKVLRDSYGNVSEIAYFDEQDSPTVNQEGWHKLTNKVNEHGYAREQWFFDAKGRVITEKANGCFGYLHQYTDEGVQTQWTCMGYDKKPTASKGGFVSLSMELDERARVVREQSLDAEGKPIWNREGFAARRFTYDHRGRITKTEHLGPEGEMVSNRHGAAIYSTDYDDLKQISISSALNPKGKPVTIDEGHAITKRIRDIWGNLVEETYFDQNNRPARSAGGHAGFRQSYGPRGQLIETMYLGKEGEVVFRKEGYAGWQAEFNELGRRTLTRYVGLRKEAILSPQYGAAGWYSTYDVWGNENTFDYFGLDGKPIVSAQGEAGFRVQRDAWGNALEWTYVNLEGKPTLRVWDNEDKFSGSGYAIQRQSFDEHGNTLELAYFGSKNEPVLHPQGWARVKHLYDSKDNAIQSEYFGLKDEPVQLEGAAGGYHRVERKYDPWGNAVEILYFGIDGKPFDRREGYARLLKEFDRFGKTYKQSMFKADGSKATLSDGTHLFISTRDDYGRITKGEDFGPQDPPNKLRWNKNTYDEHGNLVETRHFDGMDKLVATSSAPCPVEKWTFDKYQQLKEEICLDENEKALAGLEKKAARIEFSYDDKGQVVRVQFFDKDNKPLRTSEGYTSYRFEYDERGRKIEERYEDGEGHLAKTELGFSRVRFRYDEFDRLIEQSYADEKDAAVQPVAKMQIEYDKLGRRVLDRYLAPGDRHTSLDRKGQHETHYEYDSYGKLLSISYKDTNMKPTRGYARFYDSTWQLCGRWIAEYDVDGKRKGNGRCEKEIPASVK